MAIVSAYAVQTSTSSTTTTKKILSADQKELYLPPTLAPLLPSTTASSTTESEDYYFEIDVDNLHGNTDDNTNETDESGTTEPPIGLPIDIEGGGDPSMEISPACLASLCG